MPTGQAVVTNALKILGVCEQGGTPSVSDSQDTLAELNAMWDAWGIDEGLIYAEQVILGNLTTGVPSYTIGEGATFNTPRPARIYKAHFVVGNNRNELDIVPAGRYYSHNDLAAAAATPDELYPDFNVDGNGFAKLYLWPVPTFLTGAPQLELETAINFTAWTLAANYRIPQGYQDPIQHVLAFRMIPFFGAAVSQAIVETVKMLAEKGEARIREMNAINRKMPAPAQLPPAAAKA